MRSLDLRGLRCPLPALKTRKAISRLAPGETLEVLSDDPLAAIDIPNVAREAGRALALAEPFGSALRFVVRGPGAAG